MLLENGHTSNSSLIMSTVLWILALLVLHNTSMISASVLSRCKLDLGLVVDTTKSIRRGNPQNVYFLKESIKLLIQAHDVSESGTHVSLETFAEESVLHNKFNNRSFHSNKAMEDLVEKSIGKLTMPTRLDYAIFEADEEMFTEQSGDRAGVRSVMLLFTDGKSHPNTTNFMGAVNALKKKGIRIVVVAIGKFSNLPKYRAVLRKIAGENVVYVKDYETLQSVTDDIQAIICPPSTCKNSAGLDVAFLVDRTRSVGRENFKLLKGFLLEIIDALDIGPNATHTAFILFHKRAKVLNTFNDSAYHSNEEVHHLIEDTSNFLGWRTFIDRALEAANNQLFTVQGGDRPKFPNVLILLTDGKTNIESKPYEEIIPHLEAKNVRIAVVGIGKKVLPEELERIAGDKVYYANAFSDLPDLFSAILNETCSADGQFSRWSFWSECSVTCGGNGVQTRTRTCTNPPPQGYGVGCVGDHKETRACIEGPCPLVTRQQGEMGAKLPELKRSKSGFKWSKMNQEK